MVDPDAKLEEELVIRPNQRGRLLEYVQGLDTVVRGSADPGQSVGQRGSLGNAPACFCGLRVSLAGGHTCPCQFGRSRG